MPSLETFEIRFGRADFCCAVGFRPHLGIKFEPISETISLPLNRLNAETTTLNLGVGRSITYSTEDDVSNSKIFLQLLEKNDFEEFQNIATAEFSLRSGSFEGPIWFISVYDRTFELGTIEISAQILVKKPKYNPLKVKTRRKSGRRKSTSKSKNRPKTAPSGDVLDLTRIQKTPSICSVTHFEGGKDVGAISNPPPLFYRSETRGIWQSDESARIVNLLKNGTEDGMRIIPPKPKGDARLFNVTNMTSQPREPAPSGLKECPLVTQIIDELNSLNTRFSAKSDSSDIATSDAIRNIKNYNKATRLSSPVPRTQYEVPHASPCTTDDDVTIDKVSTVPVVTRRASSPNIKCRSSTSLRQSTSRLRQDLPSGTYDRYGRPTLKPVYSGIFGKKSTVDASISVQSLVSVRPKSAMTQTCSEPNLIPDFIPERKAGQKSAATQTVGDTGLRQQTVLSVDITGKQSPKAPTPTPRGTTNQSSVTSFHISMPSVASETVTSMSQTSVQYSDDFTDEDNETDFEKSRSESFRMIPQRSKSPVMNWRMLEN